MHWAFRLYASVDIDSQVIEDTMLDSPGHYSVVEAMLESLCTVLDLLPTVLVRLKGSRVLVCLLCWDNIVPVFHLYLLIGAGNVYLMLCLVI